MWSGIITSIPLGWLLCNGENGTPDLRDRFIVGAGLSYGVGDTGGSATVTLTTDQMPSHTHGNDFSVSLSDLKCSTGGNHNHKTCITKTYTTGSSTDNYVYAGQKFSWDTISTESAGDHSHTISGSGSLSGSISSAGSGQEHENRPPYYALAFIMKL